MKIDILTLFPEMFAPIEYSVLGRARQNGLLDITVTNIRDFSTDKHKKCDDYPFGGGAGMVMMPQPIHDCVKAIDPCRNALRIYLSPKGEKLTQKKVVELAKCERLLLLCGHYEGVDQRVLDLDFDCEISVGDYILTGGELPGMLLVDAVARYVPGVLGSEESTKEESFSGNLLEYPQYTRPQVFEGVEVPDVLVSGHHENIAKWRKQCQIELTARLRPDLLEKSK